MAVWLLTGCGGPGPQSTTEPPGSVQSNAQDHAALTITPAERVVSLTPGITELIFAVGAGDQLVASVDYADYPAEARALPRIGDAFRVDAERLLALKPDLVLAGGSHTPKAVQEAVAALGLRLVNVEAQRLSDVATALRQVGELTGHGTQAEQVAMQFVNEVARLGSQYQAQRELSVFIEVNRQPLYTVNGAQIISEALSLCGGRNVFAQLDQLAPVISVEAVLQANPEVIISTESSAPELRREWQRWSQLRAVQTDRLYVVSPDALTRATPRLLTGIQQLCTALTDARRRADVDASGTLNQ